MNSSYFDVRNIKNIEKIREICCELPDTVTEFLVSIQLKTTPLTRLGYAGDLKIFFNYLVNYKFHGKKYEYEINPDDLSKIKAYDIELFLDYLSSYTLNGKKYKCGNIAKSRKLATLRSFFKFLYRRDYTPSNVLQKVETPKKQDKPIRFLEKNEVSELLHVANNGNSLTPRQKAFQQITKKRDIALLSLFLGTGIRISECVGLNKSDLDLSICAINITRKGGNKAVLYFSQEVARALEDYIAWLDQQINNNTPFAQRISDKNALFLSLKGGRITVRAVEQLVNKYASIVSPLKHITPHKLRSTFGTALYRETNDIYVVADILGHKDVNTTKKHYAAISDEIRKNAANVVKLHNDTN